jgi:hypothetical protein
MVDRIARITLPAKISAALAMAAMLSLPVRAQAPAPATELKIIGGTSSTQIVDAADLKKMPRKTLTVVNPHNKRTEVYEGVPLEELLHRAGVPQGEQLRGPALATYVVAEAEDGYRVVFSLAELDSGIQDADVLVADAMDGAPLGTNEGPFKLVAPHEKRPARWVRMLKSITVVRIPNQ